MAKSLLSTLRPSELDALLEQQPVWHTVKARPIAWFFGVLVAYIVLPAVARKLFVRRRYPSINDSPFWDLFNLSSTIGFFTNGRNLVQDGFQKFAGKPFVLNTDVVPRIVLSPDHIDAVNASKDLGFLEWVKVEFLTSLPCFKFFDPPGHLINDMVRTRLTQALPKIIPLISSEAALALDDIWGTSADWQEHVLKTDNLTLISRLSAIVFTGPELAHNKEWQRITIEVTINGFIGVIECRSFPKSLQWLVSLVMPHAVKAGTNLRRGQALVRKILDRRQLEKREAERTGAPAPQYNDAIFWLEDMITSGKYPGADAATMQLSLAMAAIHTSTDLLTQSLFQICVRPELIPELRAEIVRAVGSMGWTKQALQELRLLDSFLKETQRLQNGQALVMHRIAGANVELPGGIHIRKGEQLAISTHWMTDESFYENALHFDPYRFVKRRDDPALANKSHLVSTSVEHTGFSHGKHACPGRFFAANEIKIALAHMLMKYDLELVDKQLPKPLAFGINSSSNAEAKIRFRRRKEEFVL